MQVVLTLFNDSKSFQPITRLKPIGMLPVLNRPILEWHIMNCVRNGIKIIDIIAVENPLAVGEFVHPDTRWGASIEMLVYKDPCGFRELLTRISGLVQDKVLIIPAEILINVEYQYLVNLHHSKTTITKVLTDGCVDFHSNKQSHNCYKKLSPVSIETGIYIVDKGALNSSEEIAYSWDGSFVSIKTPRDLWIANMTALMGCFDNFLGSDYRRPSNNEPKIGHHTYTDSTVVLKTPCLIGDHCKINSGVSVSKFSVIGNGVIIDHGATIESSVIFKDTYVGTDTSIENCLVSGNVMMNLDIGSWTSVDDQFLLSGVKKRLEYSFSEKLFDKSLALLLLIATSPVWTIKGFIRVIGRKSFFAVRQFMVRDVYFDPTSKDAARAANLYWFDNSGPLVEKLPCLVNVVLGELRLVGVRPLGEDEFGLYQEDWAQQRFEALDGLFTPVDAECVNDALEEEKITAESYYTVTRNLKEDFKILIKSIKNLLTRT